MEIPDSKYKYGIVVDSGSSGSRLQVYRWPDPKYVAKNTKEPSILQSPPKITQEPNWSMKTTPGISTYSNKVKKIWPDHFKKLIKFAEEIVPKDKQSETPIFVLATAGMRLLTPKDQKKLLSQTCLELKKNSKFVIHNCGDHIQIIDGETEGIYGWVGLNYLMNQLENYDGKDAAHESIGFMDMGGASTQIAFVPSYAEDIKEHREDISRVTLRNVNGLTQEWNVFVETWLGFGANQARKRYLSQLVELSKINSNVGTSLNDPCLPKNAEISYDHDGTSYKISGIGDYEMCIRTIYPLLMKNVPCKEEPCLFNGVHAPRLNFDKDKFVGISEYWYTANDVFQSGGEYNYRIFNERVKKYCESNWADILENSGKGEYSKLDPDKFLKDACFKASWVINILHEGFDLPRLDLELPKEDVVEGEEKEITKVHVPFKSTDAIDGNELSWTLGKMLLYASSEIPSKEKDGSNIGVYPSEISGKKFVPAGGFIDGKGYDSDDDDNDKGFLLPLLVFLLLMFLVYNFAKGKVAFPKHRRFNQAKKLFFEMISKVPGLNNVLEAQLRYNELNRNDMDITLEEGALGSSQSSPNLTQLRTRSAINLSEGDNFAEGTINPQTNFLNKPFAMPKKSPFFQSQNNSRESLQRSVSNMSVQKSRNID
ncbi:hypothetical protein CANTEDRAFT_126815 [Yamadazyma tenuis ATCC 10573]|uniref:Golgi apyrase n=1 Tax=Candida tenuis (strain ATCC 10573 / BCRC 21748 / CBS 615 / JCM 9827 / NBRC 10315 / NRRL Y-1498 / VKM Y-70) TaxID=590646 RepID=G3BFC6_CANTC|nr:uncharacterized protein CANTEDRAFT_126815 [Yamadazyma tenuis ATCC 10573]EGV60025.1 hypothetical protein CANTEDRAFT_126815 [Yamadazyma tenuis ATCC 10573]